MSTDQKSKKQSQEDAEAHGAFSETHWTTVLKARGSSTSAQAALNKLCLKYWRPVYAYARRWNHPHHKAQDLTQGFFGHFLKRFPELELGPAKGKFRSFLLACLVNFLRKDWRRSPNDCPIPPEELDRATEIDANHDVSPEYTFDVVWATTLVQKALDALAVEYRRAGKELLHERLLPFISDRPAEGVYATLAAELQMNEGALRVALHHLRRRFGGLLRVEVAHTVPHVEDTDEELHYLLSLWGAHRAPASQQR